jgi:sortase B
MVNSMKWRNILVIIMLGVFLYSSYQIFSYLYEGWKSDSAYNQIRRQYEEQLQTEAAATDNITDTAGSSRETSIMERYKSLLEINSDLVGWITVPNTVINYPVVQSGDNNYYLRRDFNGNRANAGTIFMDYRCDARCRGKHIILYGHHMRNGSMFKDLVKYKREDFFQKNGYIRFDTLYEEIEWEVFSVYITEVDFPYGQTAFDSDEEYITFLEGIKGRSMFEKDIELTEEAQILTLSTCTYEYDNARLVVHARRVRE